MGTSVLWGVSYFCFRRLQTSFRPGRHLLLSGTAERNPLADQRTLPNAAEEFFELSKILAPKLSAPFVLDVAEDLVDF